LRLAIMPAGDVSPEVRLDACRLGAGRAMGSRGHLVRRAADALGLGFTMRTR
jgi:hypothetical protein